MTLNTSGPISLGGTTVGQSINLELGFDPNFENSLNYPPTRALGNAPSGTISFSNFYGTTTTVPSFSQQVLSLQGSGYTGNPRMGLMNAISADGTTMVQAAPENNSNIGAIWIWTRSGTTWTQQAGPLVPTYTGTTPRIASDVAISDDGNTVAIGSIWLNGTGFFGIGGAWIWTRSGTTWTQQAGPLVGSGYTGSSSMQGRISLSADGNTLAVGAQGDNNQNGAVWVWTRSGSSWSQQAGPITVATSFDKLGISTALSADGNTMAVGAASGVYVFTRSGSTWSQQGSKLIPLPANYNETGYGVSLSSDGNTLSVGAPSDTSTGGGGAAIGAVYVFSRSGSTWTQMGGKIVPNNYIGSPRIGFRTCLSSDGTMLAFSGHYDNNDKGAAWIYYRSGTAWIQAQKLTCSDQSISIWWGQDVNFNRNGATYLTVGAPGYGAALPSTNPVGFTTVYTKN